MAMTLQELEARYPKLTDYTKNMPEELRRRCTVRTHPAGSIIHQKNMELDCFGIIADGDTRVINEFENGNVYMIEQNRPIDFVGEVTIMAGMPRTSVTIEASTPVTAVYMSRRDAERWISQDMNIMTLICRHVAFKLYRSSYTNGAKLFYPPGFLLLDYMVKQGCAQGMDQENPPASITIDKTRQVLQEEIGINVKTLNRTIRQLKEEGFLGLCKGKITFDREQWMKGIEWLEREKGN